MTDTVTKPTLASIDAQLAALYRNLSAGKTRAMSPEEVRQIDELLDQRNRLAGGS